MSETVYLGLGSNLGDRRSHIEAALEKLEQLPGIKVQAVSQLRETDPVGGVRQRPFLNGAARLSCRLSPRALLEILKELEREAGRDFSAPPNSPRPLDLDILLFGDLRLLQRGLIVPHPRMAEREFVLEPLTELGVEAAALEVSQRPVLLQTPSDFAGMSRNWAASGAVTGLVPTMGALHEGHASLLRMARRECDLVAATIFVNPLQFAAGEDLEDYPRTLPGDLDVLRREGVDAVFVPEPGSMYPGGFQSQVAVGAEAEGLEGATRPGHFAGVATVVAKLFAVSNPTRAYFGRKDAQQLAVIRRMATDLGFPVTLRECPIVREPDGLAMSSRNRYLQGTDREAATSLYRAITCVCRQHQDGERDRDVLLAAGRQVIATEPRIRLDYLELRREPDLGPLPDGPVERGRVLIAAWLGEDGPRPVRLIDNASLREADEPDSRGGPDSQGGSDRQREPDSQGGSDSQG